jgi:DNA-formamidopyrimidine glycosylase
MAEGPAVLRWARALRELVGEQLLEVRATRRWHERASELVGASVLEVEARGKHLLLHVSTGDVIHAHAMQYGSWQVGEAGLALRKEARYIRLRLRTAEHEAVYYHGPVMEILTPDELAAHPALAALGPDVMREEFDVREVARRLRRASDRAIGDAILDQRIVAGIGNIFKSEGLFLARIDPRLAADEVSIAAQRRLWRELRPIMHAAAERFGPTTTRSSGNDRHWVYRRRGRSCFTCGTPVEMIRQGELSRATYFCPRCQRS